MSGSNTQLPLWPFPPDWSNTISETLEWKTAILTSDSGAEQRYAIRNTPRRQWDIDYLFTDYDRTLYDLWMMNYGGGNFLLPLPTEIVWLADAVEPGQIAFPCDPTLMELQTGSLIGLMGDNAFVNEVLTVLALTPSGITTTTPARNYYGRRARFAPAILVRIGEAGSVTRQAARTFKGTMRFQSAGPSKWPLNNRPVDPYLGFAAGGGTSYPVVTDEPDAISPLDYSYERTYKSIDNDSALPVYTDTAQRAFPGQKYTWFLSGRANRVRFRDWLYMIAGQRGAFWMPTFNDDLGTLGMPAPGGTQPGREYAISFQRSGGIQIFGTTPSTYTVFPPGDLDASASNRISFIDLKRFNTDSIEIVHNSDMDGVANASILCRAAPDLRVVAPYSAIPYPNILQAVAVGSTATTPVVQPPNPIFSAITITG